MKNRALIVFTLGLLMISLAMLPMPAFATTPIDVSGTWRSANPPSGSSISFSVKKAGANAFFTLHSWAEYFEGDILGGAANIEQTIGITFHYSDPEFVKTLPTSTLVAIRTWEPTEWNWHVDRTFTGTVLGIAGSFTMHLEAKGFGRLGFADMVLEGTWVITGGTGGLANLHGQGTWHALGPQLNEYEGQVHFDP